MACIKIGTKIISELKSFFSLIIQNGNLLHRRLAYTQALNGYFGSSNYKSGVFALSKTFYQFAVLNQFILYSKIAQLRSPGSGISTPLEASHLKRDFQEIVSRCYKKLHFEQYICRYIYFF